MPAHLPHCPPVRRFGVDGPHSEDDASAAAVRNPSPQDGVGRDASDELRDAEHERAIDQARRELERAQAELEVQGHTFANIAERDLCHLRFEELLRARSPAQRARMEADLQARIARSPGGTRA